MGAECKEGVGLVILKGGFMLIMKRIHFYRHFSISCVDTSEVFFLGEINSTLFFVYYHYVLNHPTGIQVCKAFTVVFNMGM